MIATFASTGPVGRLARWLELRRLWHREYARVARELAAYTELELMRDLLPPRSAIPELAAEAADLAVAKHRRAALAVRPSFRPATV